MPENITDVNMMPYRRKMQIIFRPSASLDPCMTVGEIVGRPSISTD